MTKEYIERGAVCNDCNNQRICVDKTRCPVGRASAADVVEVKHGRWHDVYSITPWMAMGVCSCCCNKSFINPDFPWATYCPNCGAKMDGE